MPRTIQNDAGEDIEVFTSDEIQAQIDERVKAKEDEHAGVLRTKEEELAETRKALVERAGEFKQFRKLNEDSVAKLSVAERTIYENTVVMNELREKAEGDAKAAHDRMVDDQIRTKAGTSDALYQKLKDTYSLIGIEAVTPEEVSNKISMALGAIGTVAPDLLATIGGIGGIAVPAGVTEKKESFADRPEGQGLAERLGLKIKQK